MGAATSRVPHPDHTVDWYRTKLDPAVSARVHALSDAQGAFQTLGFLSCLLGSGAAAVYFAGAGHNAALSVAFALLYCGISNFCINAMHELGHGAVFRTRALNGVFMRVVSFLGWLQPDLFFSSHLRHHRYTQNAPHDQENPMPIVITLSNVLQFGFVNVKGAISTLSETVRSAVGSYPTGHLGWRPEWEEICYPHHMPSARTPAMAWAWVLLVGHATFAAVCVSHGWGLLPPALLSFGPFCNGWLFFLCNSTQHVGLEPGVADFRRNTRSFELHPVLSFFYWRMNYHIEHHMYANVPCYRLKELHEAIKHDLPPTPDGLWGVWRDIAGKRGGKGE